jgi:hypothetical protein
LDSVNENIFDISERFDAPGIAKRKTVLEKLEFEATKPRPRPSA